MEPTSCNVSGRCAHGRSVKLILSPGNRRDIPGFTIEHCEWIVSCSDHARKAGFGIVPLNEVIHRLTIRKKLENQNVADVAKATFFHEQNDQSNHSPPHRLPASIRSDDNVSLRNRASLFSIKQVSKNSLA